MPELLGRNRFGHRLGQKNLGLEIVDTLPDWIQELKGGKKKESNSCIKYQKQMIIWSRKTEAISIVGGQTDKVVDMVVL
jgi:hypothetical protein